MRKIIIVFIVVAVVTGMYYFLHFYYHHRTVDTWRLVHKNAVAVYETENVISVWNEIIRLPLWENLSSIEELKSLNASIQFLDSLTGPSGNLEKLTRDKPFIISLHKISNNSLDFVFFFPVNTKEKSLILNNLLSHFRNDKDFQVEIRTFEGMEVTEIRNQSRSSVFTGFIYKDHFIGSFTPYLVEDVIRNISGKYQAGFRENYSSIFEMPVIRNDLGNLYINFSQMPGFLNSFADPNLSSQFTLLNSFSGPGYYDINSEEGRLLFNGATVTSEPPGSYYMETVSAQFPDEIKTFRILPGRTAYCYNFTFHDFALWRQEIDLYWELNAPQNLKKKIDFLGRYDIMEKEFYEFIGNEISLAVLESIDFGHPSKLLLIHCRQIGEAIRFMDNLTLTVNYTAGDTLFYEEFAGNKIKQLGIPEFPSSLLGPLYSGFENTYFTEYYDFLILGNSLESVKIFIDDMEGENTWGKSVSLVQYFDNIQKTANMSLFVNMNRTYGLLYHSVEKKWQEFLKKYERQVKTIEVLSFQFSNINNTIYSSMVMQYRPQAKLIERPSEFFTEELVTTQYPINYPAKVVRSHLDKSLEVITQDTSRQIYLISGQGEVLWKKNISANIKTEIFQIDYYKNQKLQYLFATKDDLHLLDRNGEYVTGYPVSLGDSIQIEWLNVIDYDNSKNYRFMVADVMGNIFLTDKTGKVLEGWEGKYTGGPLSGPPFHVRIRGRDCLIGVEKRGIIHVFNRQGEYIHGFPFDLKSQTQGPVFYQPGADIPRTLLHVILKSGELLKINFLGEVLERKQLYRPNQDSHYEIVTDLAGSSYKIARMDFNKVTFLEPEGVTIFETELLYSGELDLQYYNFGANNEVYAITDRDQEFTYLYVPSGRLVNDQPLESSFRIAIVYSDAGNRFKIYHCYGNQFRTSVFFRE